MEDNEGDILLTTEALQEGRIANSIEVVRDGEEAINYLLQRDSYAGRSIPDLILLDVNLPKMSGHEVLKFIKSTEVVKHIPVIMLTTSSAENDILDSYLNHANCYITKPVELTSFIEMIASIENFWISIVQLPGNVN